MGLAVAASAFSAAARPRLAAPRSAAVDILPLWLGAGLVLDGKDPLDPALASARFREEKLPLKPGGFFCYYPPTAAILALPMRLMEFRSAVAVVRWGGALATPLGVALAVAAAFPRGRRGEWRLGVAALGVWVGAAAICARPARVVLGTAQIGPWVVLALGAALLLLARGRPGWAAALAGWAAALKLAGLVLLPGLLGRGGLRGVLAFAAVPVLASLGLMALGVPVDLEAWVRSVVEFGGRGLLPDDPRFGPVVRGLLKARGGLAVGGIVVAGLWLGIKRRGGPLGERESVGFAAVGLTGLGLVMSGSAHAHEALLAFPGVGYMLAWPFAVRSRLAIVGAASLLGLLVTSPEGFMTDGPRDSGVWVPVAALAHGLALLRLLRGGDEAERTG